MNLDILRYLVSYLVISIHISPFKQINENLNFFVTRILGRIAVPIFVMVTGYYILKKALENKKVLEKYTIKILKIYGICILIYLPINIIIGRYTGKNLIYVLKDVLINGTYLHLWYFPAIVLGLWITYLLLKKTNLAFTTMITIFLYIFGMLGDSYYGITKTIPILLEIYANMFKIFDYTRNGIFYIPIFLLMGYIICLNKEKTKIKEKDKEKYKEKMQCENKKAKIKIELEKKEEKHKEKQEKNIKEKVNQIEKKKQIKIYAIYSILFFILMTIEAFILKKYNMQKHDSMYIFLIPLMYCLFNFNILIQKGQNIFLRDVSTLNYILHPLVMVCIVFFAKKIRCNILYDNNLIYFILVAILTTIISVVIVNILKTFKEKRGKIEKREKTNSL